MKRWMIPQPRLPLRIGIFAGLMLLLALSPGAWVPKLTGVLMISFLVGSYRESFIEDETLSVQLVVCFIPMKRKKYRLRKFSQIEIMLDPPAGWWTFFLFGPFQWIWSRVLDFAIPWFGGLYQLWLVSPKKRVLVWQGCSDSDFENNLKELQTTTALEVLRTGGF